MRILNWGVLSGLWCVSFKWPVNPPNFNCSWWKYSLLLLFLQSVVALRFLRGVVVSSLPQSRNFLGTLCHSWAKQPWVACEELFWERPDLQENLDLLCLQGSLLEVSHHRSRSEQRTEDVVHSVLDLSADCPVRVDGCPWRVGFRGTEFAKVIPDLQWILLQPKFELPPLPFWPVIGSSLSYGRRSDQALARPGKLMLLLLVLPRPAVFALFCKA